MRLRYRWRVRRSLGLLALGASALGCRPLTDPPLPPGAERYAPPPVYARWWATTEACSGITRPLAAVAWYAAPGLTVPAGRRDASAYWSAPGNRIVVSRGLTLEGATIRHEMLHALLRAPGHPRGAFLGRCAAVVDCTGPCVADAGPGPRPAPGAPVVPVTALRFSLAVDPPPAVAPADGFLTFTVRVRNPAPYSVVVRAVAPGPGRPGDAQDWASLPGFGFIVMGPELTRTGGFVADDTASAVFGPGEVRAKVFDFALTTSGEGLGRLPGQGFNGVALGRGHYRCRARTGRCGRTRSA